MRVKLCGDGEVTDTAKTRKQRCTVSKKEQIIEKLKEKRMPDHKTA